VSTDIEAKPIKVCTDDNTGLQVGKYVTFLLPASQHNSLLSSLKVLVLRNQDCWAPCSVAF
jgi:hypothetical protein